MQEFFHFFSVYYLVQFFFIFVFSHSFACRLKKSSSFHVKQFIHQTLMCVIYSAKSVINILLLCILNSLFFAKINFTPLKKMSLDAAQEKNKTLDEHNWGAQKSYERPMWMTNETKLKKTPLSTYESRELKNIFNWYTHSCV